jgi:hypothetical protein
MDQYSSTFGELCVKCGQHPREPNRKWCRVCREAPALVRAAFLAGAGDAMMAYRDVPGAIPDQGRPGACQFCGPVGTVTRDDGSEQCRVCGTVRV